jgi:fructose-1,6-bisphosphatase/inositol monophosphatase family enzyme
MRLALYQCGRIAMSLQGRVVREDKAPDSVHQTSTEVSVVDRLCQEILLLRAHECAPGLEVQSEELADCPPDLLELYATKSSRYVLILDPVDGTGEYLQGRQGYAHMLGLLNQDSGRMDCGMIYFPARGRLYSAVRGIGAFVADGFWATPHPLRTQQPPRTVEDVKRLQPTDYVAFERLGYQTVPPESASAANELTRVAEGRLGAMVMRHFHGHDTAISSVIIEELGGLVVTEGGRAVTYEREMPRMPLVISSLRPEIARELVATL